MAMRWARPEWRGRRVAVVALALGTVLVAGCPEGRAPYETIPQQGAPDSFLPPEGIVPGTSRARGVLYRFDRTRYRLFFPIAGTDPHYIHRDSVLALASAALPGQPVDLRVHPDLYDTELARVYSNPKLFGFTPSEPAQAGQFVEGRKVLDAHRYFPLQPPDAQPGDWWETNHNEGEWTVVDSIVGPGSAPTGQGMPVVQLRTISDVTSSREPMFLPPLYAADLFATSAPGYGVQFHAWTLISERDVPPDLRNPPGPRGLPDRQRNPRFLWLSIQSLDFSRDPLASPPVTIDQCLDNLPSHLDLFPVVMCRDTIQEGDIFTTWTHLTVDRDVLHERLDSEAQLPRGGRCGIPVPIGTDTLRMFPTNSFRLLCKFESRVERIVDQIELRRATETTGLYPITPSPGAVVEFRITMFVLDGPTQGPAQFLELWYLRDIGQVVRRQGVNSATRSAARLARCRVNGVQYDQPNSVFAYRP